MFALIVAGIATFVIHGIWEKRAYPLLYEDIIKKYAKEYSLDPYLLAAIIKTESGFREDAVSRVGALGLMQLMPSTAEWISGKVGEDYREDMLTDPDTNIRYGCWYLRFLTDRFGDDLPAVLAAYNAGHNKVSEWLRDDAISPGGTLGEIPYPEAKQYVERVYHAVEKYKQLYEME